MRLRWLVLLLLSVLTGFAWLVLSPAPALRQGPLVVTIPPHDGLLGIADRLVQAQVIRSRPAFVGAAIVRGVPRSLKAGEYELPRDASTWEIVALLESGRVRQHAILHPEGATVAELARALEAERLAGVEAGARTPADPKFLGMPLQADPTVQYAVAKERRALSRADLAIDHPYNTYVHPGLPPGPIASPGLEAIQAALDPAPVKYLYFVARDDRRHHFSTTMEEHNAAVTRYRLSRR